MNSAPQDFLRKLKEAIPKKTTNPNENAPADTGMQRLICFRNSKLTFFHKLADNELDKLHIIFNGSLTTKLYLDFLARNNNTDLLLLKNIKTATENKTAILHTGTVIANALMHAGTSIDVFMR